MSPILDRTASSNAAICDEIKLGTTPKWYTVYSANYIFASLILMQGGRDPDGPVDREKARKDAQV